jgi:hypothetical protein
MLSSTKLSLVVVCIMGAPLVVSGQQVQTFEAYKGPDPTSCAAPPAAQSFLNTDSSVNVYFSITGLNGGEVIKILWYNPSGANPWYTAWNPVAPGYALDCFWTDFGIAAFISPSWGHWQAQITVNDQPIGSRITFDVETAAIEPRGPTYQGYLDTNATDCSHFGGWAYDSSNSTASISVDISISGFALVTVVANQARSDLTGNLANHGWNLYNLQQYEDGQTHTIHAYFHGTAQELTYAASQQFPPPGNQPSACSGGAPPTSITTGWAGNGTPPGTIIAGQAFGVGWQVSGAASIVSRVCYGTSTDPSTLCQQAATAQQTTGATSLTASIVAPAVSGAAPVTYYFVVQAQAGGQTVYSSVVSCLDTGTTIGPPNATTWIYGATAFPLSNITVLDSRLAGFTTILQRQQKSSSIYEYTLSVIGADASPLNSALLTVVRKNAVTAVPTTYQAQINYSNPSQILANFPQNLSSSWQTAPDANASQPGQALGNAVIDLLSFDEEIGLALNTANLANNLAGFANSLLGLVSSANVYPTSALRIKLNDINDYHQDKLAAVAPSILLAGGQTFGFRFVFDINEQNGQPEQFFLRTENAWGSIVGLEIGTDGTGTDRTQVNVTSQ